MNFIKFKQLLDGGEKRNVDFKLTCNAFHAKIKKPNAELAKDICAMCNNGNMTSYIVVGVSDDARKFKSVTNLNLIDDNLQTLCKTSIDPPPRVKLYRKRWAKVPKSFAYKNFVIIQIGPHAEKPFRLAQDFISYHEKLCYRRNEVWIRRGTTSDLAIPEEIFHLMKGQALRETREANGNIQYSHVPRNEQGKAILNDMKTVLSEIGGYMKDMQLCVPIGKKKYVWRLVMLRTMSTNMHEKCVVAEWQYEHGILFLVNGSVSKQTFGSANFYLDVNFRQKWGWFSYYGNLKDLFSSRRIISVNSEKIPLITVTLHNIGNTNSLRDSFLGMLQFIGDDEDTHDRIIQVRTTINKNLKKWLKHGWLFGTGRHYMGFRPKKSDLKANEFFSRRRGEILINERPEILTNRARKILDLSVYE